MSDKTKKSEKSLSFKSEEFKKLQSDWYAKLDDSGFDDIERPCTYENVYFDQYGGLLKRSTYSLGRKYSFSDFNFYQTLRKFSHSASIRTFYPLKPFSAAADYQILTKSKKIKLTSYDRIILRLSGNGATIRETAAYLKARCRPKKKLSFSLYYVHTRLKWLINLIKYAEDE